MLLTHSALWGWQRTINENGDDIWSYTGDQRFHANGDRGFPSLYAKQSTLVEDFADSFASVVFEKTLGMRSTSGADLSHLIRFEYDDLTISFGLTDATRYDYMVNTVFPQLHIAPHNTEELP